MACIRIERVQNGYEVSATDPKVRAENDKSNTKWINPEREYVFKTIQEVNAFVEKIEKIALPLVPNPPDSFAVAFNAAVADDKKEGEKK